MSIQKPTSQENLIKIQNDAGVNPSNSVTIQKPNTQSTSITTSTNPVGRPTKYKPEYCQELITHMKRGLSFEAFAGHVGVCVETIYTWLRQYPEFLDARAEALSRNRLFWEQIGIAGTTGKIKNFNSAMAIFNLKNRFPKEWREKQEVEHSGQVDIKDSSNELKERLMALLAEKVALQAQEILNDPQTIRHSSNTGLLASAPTRESQPEYDARPLQAEPLSNSQESPELSGDDPKDT